MAKLTEQQLRFIELYMSNGMNTAKAAKDAGYSQKNAASIGCMLLRKPHVIAKIEEVQQQIAEKIDVDVELIQDQLVENVKLARKAGRFTDSNTAIKLIGELIGAFQQDTGSQVTVNILELLGKVDRRDEKGDVIDADIKVGLPPPPPSH